MGMDTKRDRLVFTPAVPATLMGRGAVTIAGASASVLFLKSGPSVRVRAGEATIMVSLPDEHRLEIDVVLERREGDERGVWQATPGVKDRPSFDRLLARLRKA
jgi:hypothetical protein